MITLEQLKAHAAANPKKLFPLGSCTDCLAADLTGHTMRGHSRFLLSDETVDPRFAKFTRAASGCHVAGGLLAECITDILAGRDPAAVGHELWEATRGT